MTRQTKSGGGRREATQACMFRAIFCSWPTFGTRQALRVVESAGMRAITTASNALAPVNGHGHLPPHVAFGALRRIADVVGLPVTADLEDGYGLHRRNSSIASPMQAPVGRSSKTLTIVLGANNALR